MSISTLLKIERDTEKLSVEEQLELIEILVGQMRRKTFPEPKKLLWEEIYGIGEGIWNGEDAQDYINRN